MYVDSRLLLVDRAKVASNGTTVNSSAVGNVIDLGEVESARRIFNGQPLYLNVFVTAAFAGAGTVEFNVVSSNAENLSSPEYHAASGEIPIADLARGDYLSIPIGQSQEPVKRYVGLRVESSANATAGNVIAFISDAQHGNVPVRSTTSGG